MNRLRAKILQRCVLQVGHLVRITKEMLKFAKGCETFQQKYFDLPMLFSACHNLLTNSDLQARTIEGNFHNNELVKVTVSPHTESKQIK
jgi:hypothetical protein